MFEGRVEALSSLRQEARQDLQNYFSWKLHEIRDRNEEKPHTISELIKECQELSKKIYEN